MSEIDLNTSLSTVLGVQRMDVRTLRARLVPGAGDGELDDSSLKALMARSLVCATDRGNGEWVAGVAQSADDLRYVCHGQTQEEAVLRAVMSHVHATIVDMMHDGLAVDQYPIAIAGALENLANSQQLNESVFIGLSSVLQKIEARRFSAGKWDAEWVERCKQEIFRVIAQSPYAAYDMGIPPQGDDAFDAYIANERFAEIRNVDVMAQFLLRAAHRFHALDRLHSTYVNDDATLPVTAYKAWSFLHEQFCSQAADLQMFFSETDDYGDRTPAVRKRLRECADALVGSGKDASKIAQAESLVFDSESMHNASVDVYFRNKAPVAVVVWTADKPYPHGAYQVNEHGAVVRFALISNDDVPPHDYRKSVVGGVRVDQARLLGDTAVHRINLFREDKGMPFVVLENQRQLKRIAPIADARSDAASLASEPLGKEAYLALQKEAEGLGMAHARGEDLPHHAARLQQIDALMNASPWTLHPDYGCVLKSEVADKDQAAMQIG